MRTLQSFKITVEKEKLLETLKANRKKHAEDYKNAYNRYYNTCISELEGRVNELRETLRQVNPSSFLKFDLTNRYPQDYTNVYDQVIEMLEFCNADSIEITNSQYESWVKDDWDWKESFMLSTSAY
jgi:hypothetical protein